MSPGKPSVSGTNLPRFPPPWLICIGYIAQRIYIGRLYSKLVRSFDVVLRVYSHWSQKLFPTQTTSCQAAICQVVLFVNLFVMQLYLLPGCTTLPSISCLRILAKSNTKRTASVYVLFCDSVYGHARAGKIYVNVILLVPTHSSQRVSVHASGGHF